MLKRLNLVIVGGGKACYEVLNVLTGIKFKHLVNILGVADINPKAPGFKYAQKIGVFTTTDYHQLFKFPNIDVIIELTGRDEVKKALSQEIPPHIYLIDHKNARILWTFLEKRILSTQRKLVEVKNFLQGIFENIQDHILIIDREFRVKEINPSFLKFLGRSRSEVIGKKCYKILHNRDKVCDTPSHVCPLKEVFETGQPSKKIHVQIINGEPVYFNVAGYPIKNQKGEVIYAVKIARDVTEMKRASEELQKRHEELKTLHRITTAITSSIDLDKVLENCAQELIEILSADVIVIYLIEHGYTYFAYCHGVSQTDLPLFSSVEETWISPTNKEVKKIENVEIIKTEATNVQCKTLLCMPLMAHNKLVGLIKIGFFKQREFEEQAINLLQTIGHQIGIAVENARLHEETSELSKSLEKKVIEQTKELEKSYKEIETFYQIVQTVGEKNTLKGVFNYILPKVQEILSYKEVLPLILNLERTDFIKIKPYFEQVQFASLCNKCKEKLIKLLQAEVNSICFQPRLHCWHKKKHLPLIVPIVKEGKSIGGLLLVLNGKKPSDNDLRFVYFILSQISGVIIRILRQEERLKALKRQIATFSYGPIVGKDPKMIQIYQLIEDIAPTNATVLIQGESGTGKELIARAIHAKSLRKDKPFVVINCSAYPQTLLESELFGYEKGAFTGALSRKKGRFELANGGTIFLDEVGDIPPVSQVKLLRVLQFQEFERLGGNETIKVDVRIIAATNKDLREEVKKGNFREDLFYRLNVIPIFLPPLRERKNDIPLLVEHFIKKLNEKENKYIKGVSPEVMRILMDYDWPGNVRELENTIEHAFVLTKGDLIEKSALPIHLRNLESEEKEVLSFAENEKRFLLKMLEECNWNKMKVAKRLNISRSTLYSKLKRYNLLDKKSVH